MATHGFSVFAQVTPSSEEKAATVMFAAGSLRTAMDEIIHAYQTQGGTVFTAKYGPSGKLRQEIEAGAKVDVFASASTNHTQTLA